MISQVNVHHLELFYYVAKHRGITAASRKIPYGIQQPAISGQIAQLEKSLGAKLFQRRPFSLTPGGAALFDRIDTFFGSLGELPDQVRGVSPNHLRLAAPGMILRDYLPGLLAKQKRRRSDFRLSLHDANQPVAEELLQQGEIDLSITELEGRPGRSIESRNLVRLPLALVVPKARRIRSIADCFDQGQPSENLISLPPNEVLVRQFRLGLSRLELEWPTTIEVSSLDLVATYVSLGFGLGITVALPQKRSSTLRLVPLPKFPLLTIAALWRGELSELATSFLAEVETIAREMKISRIGLWAT